MARTRLKATAFAGVFALTACAQEEIPAAQYALDQCRRLPLLDEATGEHIRGAEDIAIDTRSSRIFLSAYDRRAVEKAARKRESALPQGGVYAVALSDLFNGEAESAQAKPLLSPSEIAGGLRPHGISFDAYNQEIVFINRAYQRIHERWVMTPSLQRIGANGEIVVSEEAESPCSANDVLVTEQQVFTSFDHGACDWRAGLEDVFRLKRSGLSSNHRGAVFDAALFANGLARTSAGDVVLAATRENALVFMKELSDGVEEAARITLPGGPDNLSISYDGGVVAAAHPSLIRLAMNRKLGIGKAPSRIVKADPETSEIDILFDDPTGKLFSAATVAVETPKGLVVGSVTDKGVLICQKTP